MKKIVNLRQSTGLSDSQCSALKLTSELNVVVLVVSGHSLNSNQSNDQHGCEHFSQHFAEVLPAKEVNNNHFYRVYVLYVKLFH